ncbi:stressosome-associated protein Prli42 [Paenibacillus hodogayensis]|uniref:Stressosome-associated protein Prli42 n=1 Tax=Paenibacillus hodogayensis TaxID=279208 RepID=A0ABV5W4Y9_9BACL
MFSKNFVKIMVYLMLFAMVSSVILYTVGVFLG